MAFTKWLCVLVLTTVSGWGGSKSGQSSSLPSASRPASHELKSQIDAIVGPYVSSAKNPGFVVGIFRNGRKEVFGYGSVSAKREARPDGRTLFEIGSVTKVFTATLLAEMAGAGLVDLEDPIRKLLPKSVRLPTWEGQEITLLHLAVHTSGLPRLPNNILIQIIQNPANPYAKYTVKDLYEFLSEHELRRSIGQKYEYSNVGMGLLGHALALKCGTTYEQAVVGRICRKLGMNDTRISLTSEQKKRLATGHSPSGQPVGYWDTPTLAGAGALYSSAEDLLKFLSANLGCSGGRLAEIMAKTCHPIRVKTDQEFLEVALAWHVFALKDEGINVFWHNGGTGGFRSWIGFIKQSRVGAVVLSNSANEPDKLGLQILLLLDETCSPEAR